VHSSKSTALSRMNSITIRIVLIEHEPVKDRRRKVLWMVWILVDNSRLPHTPIHLLRWIAPHLLAGVFPPRPRGFLARFALDPASALRSSLVIAAVVSGT
jgi:hypothetical protein